MKYRLLLILHRWWLAFTEWAFRDDVQRLDDPNNPA